MLRQKFFRFILPLISFVSISCPNNLPEWIINNGQEIKNFPSWTTSCNAFSDWMDWQSEDGKRLHQLIDDTVILTHDIFTNGIGYASIIFDANKIPLAQLPYLSLLKSIFSFVDTDEHTYAELNNDINSFTGGLSLEAGVYTDKKDPKHFSILADISTRALYGNMDKAFDLVEEVIFRSSYEDETRLYELIAELKSKLQMSLNQSGHIGAVVRAFSYFSKPDAVKEVMKDIRI